MSQENTPMITGIGIIDEKHLPDGRTIQVYHITFGKARLSIGLRDSGYYTGTW